MKRNNILTEKNSFLKLLLIVGVVTVVLNLIYCSYLIYPREVVKNWIVDNVGVSVRDCGLIGGEFVNTEDVPFYDDFLNSCSSISEAGYFYEYNPCHRCENAGCQSLYSYRVVFSNRERVLAVFTVLDSYPHSVTGIEYCYGEN